MMDKMEFIYAVCITCGHRWKAICIDGLNTGAYLECPNCGRQTGIDQEELYKYNIGG